jgi:hypothetical protein
MLLMVVSEVSASTASWRCVSPAVSRRSLSSSAVVGIVIGMGSGKRHGAKQGVTANPLDPGPGDWPVEGAQSYMRSELFHYPEAIDHLLALADLRDEWQSSPNRGRWREASIDGEPALVVASYAEQRRYERALEASPLCELVTLDYLGYLVSVVRERVSAGVWGEAGFPVGQKGAGYGRQRGAYPSMAPDPIELAVADFVHEQLGGERHPNLAPEKILRSTVRQIRRRLRQLAVS